MIWFRNTGFAALALLAFAPAALADAPEQLRCTAHDSPFQEPAPLVATSYELGNGATATAYSENLSANVHPGSKATVPGIKQFSKAPTVGPSWSYQSPRTGAVIEMGALGGGAVADRPRLAHVAIALEF